MIGSKEEWLLSAELDEAGGQRSQVSRRGVISQALLFLKFGPLAEVKEFNHLYLYSKTVHVEPDWKGLQLGESQSFPVSQCDEMHFYTHT